MSQYIVSARKYRPDSFETLIGQDNISRTLKNSILRGQLAHAYLFCGPRGVGKTSTARIFAKTINCANPTEDMEPCGHCESCESFQEGRSYCIHELDAASNNGVEDIKALMDQVQIPPQVGRYSVYIIDEVHMLSQSAFNAFLKTLEEPPAHAIFILCTTEKHKIIPTILSRCQTYDFNRISIPDMVANLRGIAAKENISIDDESLHVIAGKADGAMRDALTIFDQTVAFCGTDIRYEDVIRNLNVLDYEYSFRLVDAFLKGDYGAALLIFDEILSKGFNAQYFISALGSHLRDLLVCRTGGLESLLDLPDSLRKRYAQQAGACSVRWIFDALDITTQAESGYRSSTNQRLHIEFALMKIAFLCRNKAADSAAPAANEVPKADAPSAATAPKVEAAPAVAAAKEEAGPAPAIDISLSVGGSEELPPVEPAEVAPAPQRQAEPARRAARRGASLSLSALMAGEEPSQGTPGGQEQTGGLPDDELILKKWTELAAGIPPQQQRLASALSNAKLTISEKDGVKVVDFTVINEGQQKWIRENMLRKLEQNFHSLVGSDLVRLDVSVIPDEEVEVKPYMPVEQARDLMNKNSEVKDLIVDLGLDIK